MKPSKPSYSVRSSTRHTRSVGVEVEGLDIRGQSNSKIVVFAERNDCADDNALLPREGEWREPVMVLEGVVVTTETMPRFIAAVARAFEAYAEEYGESTRVRLAREGETP